MSKGLDALFNDEAPEEVVVVSKSEPEMVASPSQTLNETIRQIPLELLLPYPNQPFKPYVGDKLQELAGSIGDNGIINPIIIRPMGDKFQIISGHNRVNAAKIVGLVAVPALVKSFSDSEAEIILVESNLMQRKELLISEKAFAYKMKYDAIKRQGVKKDASGHGDQKHLAAEIMAENLPDSEKQIRRFISLTTLITGFLDMLDDGKLYFMAGVNLSYIDQEGQSIIYQYFNEHHLAISVELSETLKEKSKTGKLTADAIDNVVNPKNDKPHHIAAIKIKFKKIKQFFSKDATVEEVEETIIQALEEYRKKAGNQSEHKE